MATDTTTTTRTPIQIAAGVVGAVFLLVGLAGFIPGIVENHDTLEVAGRDGHALLLGLFEVSVLHNIVHLLFGVLGLAAFARPRAAKMFLIGGGAVYLALWLYGMAISLDSSANFVPFNSADNWLHFALGVGMVGLGVLVPETLTRATPAPASTSRARRA